jgi:hypothetical protein
VCESCNVAIYFGINRRGTPDLMRFQSDTPVAQTQQWQVLLLLQRTV